VRESRRDHWDRFWRSQDVEAIYEAVGSLPEEIARWIPLKGARVLEVGAGSGRDSLRLAEQGAQVSVLDYSEAALASTRRLMRGAAGVALVRGDARRLPFGDERFDLVFHQGLLEHFREPAPIIAENARVLAPGGILLVDVPQRWHPYTLVKHTLIAMDRWFAGWERSFSARELEALLRGAGLEVLASYASWPEPGLAYRVLRKGLGQMRLARLPMHPAPLPLVGPACRRARAALRYHRLGHYSAMVIGTVARKRSGSARP